METNNAPAISVIVPVYKVENYIARCLDSIKAQSFQDFEVIMIDDGSPDRSAEIAQTYTADSRFRLFRQENTGVGEVRNRGVGLARGEYIAFVDSDDSVFPDYLEKLYAAAKENNADIVCCGCCYCNESGTRMRRGKIAKRQGVYRSQQLIGNIIRDISVRRYLWSKLWKKSLFTDFGITFPHLLYEDARVIPMLFYYAQTIAVISDKSYVYTRRESSITGLTARNCIGDYISAVRFVEDFFMNTPEAEFYSGNLGFQKLKTVAVTFCWLFVRIYRAGTLDYFGTNLKKIVRYALPQPKIKDKKKLAAGRRIQF